MNENPQARLNAVTVEIEFQSRILRRSGMTLARRAIDVSDDTSIPEEISNQDEMALSFHEVTVHRLDPL
jgi:hypothetical protein